MCELFENISIDHSKMKEILQVCENDSYDIFLLDRIVILGLEGLQRSLRG